MLKTWFKANKMFAWNKRQELRTNFVIFLWQKFKDILTQGTQPLVMQREHVGAQKKRFSQDKLWLMFMISRTRLSQNTMNSFVNSRPEIMNCFCFMMGVKVGIQIILLQFSFSEKATKMCTIVLMVLKFN